MQLNINRINNDRISIYSIKEYPEIWGINTLYHSWLSIFWCSLAWAYQLRRITVVNNITSDMYELRQRNIISKILCSIFFIFFYPVMSPRYKLYINDVHYGRLTCPLAVIDQCEYKFYKFNGFGEDEYLFTFHRPNVVAVLKNEKQVAKMLFHDEEMGGKWTVYYDKEDMGDIMLLFSLTIAMDNAIFPLDYDGPIFGYPKENYPERIEWMSEE